jgi:hypothetical protein
MNPWTMKQKGQHCANSTNAELKQRSTFRDKAIKLAVYMSDIKGDQSGNCSCTDNLLSVKRYSRANPEPSSAFHGMSPGFSH